MHRTRIVLLGVLYAVVFLGFVQIVTAQPRYEMNEVVVTGTRIPATLLSSVRQVSVLDSTVITVLPAAGPMELLNYSIGADLRQRGPQGVQGDLSLRGGSFEQSLILLNGVRMNDPQTGHHSLHLPVAMENIRRVEVVRGAGSSVYGPDAFGGVVNFITAPTEPRVALNAQAGQHGLYAGTISYAGRTGPASHQIAVSRRQSDGYRPNTDFRVNTASYHNRVRLGEHHLRLIAGFTDKEFGANGFYTSRFPDQWERTGTTFVNTGGEVNLPNLSLNTQFFWRRNEDVFLLDRHDPGFYRNSHTTDSYGLEMRGTRTTGLGTTVIGTDLGREVIRSSSLGNHERNRAGLFAEHRMDVLDRFHLQTGGSAYYRTKWGWELSPSAGLNVKITSRMHLYGNYGESFRVPSFTELYYQSPANVGNPALSPEQASTVETGLRWARGGMLVNFGIFRRNGSDLIDWARSDTAGPWRTTNVHDMQTDGLETGVKLFPSETEVGKHITMVWVRYAYLKSDLQEATLQSKYVFRYLRHQVMVDLTTSLPFGIRAQWHARYEDRVGSSAHTLVDIRMSRDVAFGRFYLDITNLTDVDYQEIGGVPMPGRWIRLGAQVSYPLGKE